MDELFDQLKCTKQGLTGDEGRRRLGIFGPNKLEEKKVISLPKFKTKKYKSVYFTPSFSKL